MKKEIVIPTDLSEVPLSRYQKFLKIADENEDSEFLHHKMIEIFCGIELKLVSKIKYKDIVKISSVLTTMFNKDHEFVKTFKLGDIEFGFIPNFEDITSGEYMDLDNYINDSHELHKAMAVMYRPIKTKFAGKYTIEQYMGSNVYSEIMKNAPLSAVLGARVFFYHLGNELLKSTMTYLETNPESMNILNNLNSGKDGVGIHHYMLLVKGMLEDSMKSPNFL
jgi:hypothetical protein